MRKNQKEPETKEKYIHIRIKESEKKEMLKFSKEQGFEKLTHFLLWIYRQYKKGNGGK